jgi:ArsR family transcriptional regulator
MPIADDRHLDAPRMLVAGSVAVELEWLLTSATRPEFQADHPALADLYSRRPDLAERIGTFWTEDRRTSCGGFEEIVVLASHGGQLLNNDGDRFTDSVDEMARHAPTHPPLESELPNDRAALLARLAQLRRSARVRAAYVSLLSDLWSEVRDLYVSQGRRVVDSSVAEARTVLARGGSWVDLTRRANDLTSRLAPLVDRLGGNDQIIVVPAYFAHVSLFVSVPGGLVVGLRAERSAADARARTEQLAHRLKAIADPTRLAMLDTLAQAPRTITELASLFGVAQPTVSNHIKVLREAGLVGSATVGRGLVVRAEAVDDLRCQLDSVLGARSSS